MQYGFDGNNRRVHIDDSVEGVSYFCPQCHGELIRKFGYSRSSHFAHKSGMDCDTWTSDMSDWHLAWQAQFPTDTREKVITYNGVKHRADDGLKRTIIEFQNSPISADEFDARNRFYTSAGYKVIWLFNLIKEYTSEYISDFNEELKFEWKWASHTFDYYRPGDRKVELYFQFCVPDEEYSCVIGRAIWASPDHGFKYFMTEDWITNQKFVEETMGRSLSDLWKAHKNIRYGYFVSTVSGYEFLIDRSPEYMANHGGVKGKRVFSGRVQENEMDVYYWWQPQWKARNIEYYV